MGGWGFYFHSLCSGNGTRQENREVTEAGALELQSKEGKPCWLGPPSPLEPGLSLHYLVPHLVCVVVLRASAASGRGRRGKAWRGFSTPSCYRGPRERQDLGLFPPFCPSLLSHFILLPASKVSLPSPLSSKPASFVCISAGLWGLPFLTVPSPWPLCLFWVFGYKHHKPLRTNAETRIGLWAAHRVKGRMNLPVSRQSRTETPWRLQSKDSASFFSRKSNQVGQPR